MLPNEDNWRDFDLRTETFSLPTRNSVHHYLAFTPRRVDSLIPAYDHYVEMFKGCDIFNKMMYGRTWPHKQGGFQHLGDEGKQDDFAFSSLLLNTIVAYREINKLSENDFDYKAYCLQLSDELYEYIVYRKLVHN